MRTMAFNYSKWLWMSLGTLEQNKNCGDRTPLSQNHSHLIIHAYRIMSILHCLQLKYCLKKEQKRQTKLLIWVNFDENKNTIVSSPVITTLAFKYCFEIQNLCEFFLFFFLHISSPNFSILLLSHSKCFFIFFFLPFVYQLKMSMLEIYLILKRIE